MSLGSATALTTTDIATKQLRFSELRAGDCHQIDGTLTFMSNGTGTWSCRTWTDHNHSEDTWAASFSVLAANGAGLFKLGEFRGPRMDDGDPLPRYGWSRGFAFNPDQIDAIASATEHYSCLSNNLGASPAP
jgi:hypothetical protein